MFQMRNSVLFCYKTCACNKSWAGSQRSGLPAFRDGVPFIALPCHMILYDALRCYLVLFQDGLLSAWCSDMCLRGNMKVPKSKYGAAFYCPPDDTWWLGETRLPVIFETGFGFYCPHKIILWTGLPFTATDASCLLFHMLSLLWPFQVWTSWCNEASLWSRQISLTGVW